MLTEDKRGLMHASSLVSNFGLQANQSQTEILGLIKANISLHNLYYWLVNSSEGWHLCRAVVTILVAAIQINAILMNSNYIGVCIQVKTWKKLPVRILFQQQLLFLVRGNST